MDNSSRYDFSPLLHTAGAFVWSMAWIKGYQYIYGQDVPVGILVYLALSALILNVAGLCVWVVTK